MTLLDILPSLGQAAHRAVRPRDLADHHALRRGGPAVRRRRTADRYRRRVPHPGLRHRRNRLPASRPPLPQGAARRRGGLRRKVAADHRRGALGSRRGPGHRRLLGGELAVALAGGVHPARIVMHGNAKSPDELRDAVRVGVGRIVVDSGIEIAYLAGLARRRQRVLIRVTPDIDIHGHRRSPPASAIRSSGSRSTGTRPTRRCSGCWRTRSWTWSGCTATSARRSPTPRCTARRSTG